MPKAHVAKSSGRKDELKINLRSSSNRKTSLQPSTQTDNISQTNFLNQKISSPSNRSDCKTYETQQENAELYHNLQSTAWQGATEMRKFKSKQVKFCESVQAFSPYGWNVTIIEEKLKTEQDQQDRGKKLCNDYSKSMTKFPPQKGI